MIFASARWSRVFNNAPRILLFHYLLKYTTLFQTARLTQVFWGASRGRDSASGPLPSTVSLAGEPSGVSRRVQLGLTYPTSSKSGAFLPGETAIRLSDSASDYDYHSGESDWPCPLTAGCFHSAGGDRRPRVCRALFPKKRLPAGRGHPPSRPRANSVRRRRRIRGEPIAGAPQISQSPSCQFSWL